MNGKTAFEYLSQMSESERESVSIIWFDRDTLRENLYWETDEEDKRNDKLVDKLTNEEVGNILESSLYTASGDIQGYFNDFLDRHDEKMNEKFYEFIGE